MLSETQLVKHRFVCTSILTEFPPSLVLRFQKFLPDTNLTKTNEMSNDGNIWEIKRQPGTNKDKLNKSHVYCQILTTLSYFFRIFLNPVQFRA